MDIDNIKKLFKLLVMNNKKMKNTLQLNLEK